jgi:uncharacterized membrane protein
MKRWLCVSIGLTLVVLAASLYVYFFEFDRLPPQVPIHWNFAGEADGWVDRDNVLVVFLLMPAIMAGLVVLTLLLPWLSPRHFEVDTFRDTYAYIMTLLVGLMGYLQLIVLGGSLQPRFPNRALIGGMFLFFALLGNVLGRVRRNFWIGVRTPWTLASDPVWIQTHRLTAWLWVGFGLFGFVAVAVGVSIIWCFAGLIVAVLFPVFYSLVLYKRLEKEGRL